MSESELRQKVSDLESTVERALDRIGEQADQIDDLEEENEDLRETVEDLKNELDQRPELRMSENDDPEAHSAERVREIMFGEYPLGRRIQSRASEEDLERIDDQVDNLSERVEAVERGDHEDDARFSFSGAISRSDLMPLHQKRLVVEHMDPDDHRLTENQERAAWAFDHLENRMHVLHGTGTINSNDMRKMFERDLFEDRPEVDDRLGVDNPEPNTIKRVMRFIGEFSDSMIDLKTDDTLNRLEIDVAELREYREAVNRKAQRGPDGNEPDRNEPGGITPSSSA